MKQFRIKINLRKKKHNNIQTTYLLSKKPFTVKVEWQQRFGWITGLQVVIRRIVLNL